MYFRMWWLLPTVCLCGVGELIGWSARLWSSFSLSLHKPFMIQIVCTVVSPTPLVTVNFVLLSWIISQLGPCYGLLSPRTYTILFIFSDVLGFLIQAAGGSIAAGATTRPGARVGAHIMLAGIIFQFAALLAYCCLAGDFILRYTTERPLRSTTSDRRFLDQGTKHMIYALTFSTLVLSIRSIYRIIELGTGWHGRIMRTEVYLSVLDDGMVALAVFTLNSAYPGQLMGPTRLPPCFEGQNGGYVPGYVDGGYAHPF
ncbi:hypothetical protein MVEN_01980900 [Mycena venus]|uniref:RTA1 like protein n=1 Tax=Mycena venus TaxID=2733690 RepID=A0A8H6XDD8_9AGAR|nr:hypothetical protein MVEN_01980900 [Mycena venus]